MKNENKHKSSKNFSQMPKIKQKVFPVFLKGIDTDSGNNNRIRIIEDLL